MKNHQTGLATSQKNIANSGHELLKKVGTARFR